MSRIGENDCWWLGHRGWLQRGVVFKLGYYLVRTETRVNNGAGMDRRHGQRGTQDRRLMLIS